MLSLAPAARIDGLTGFRASPGSFCLFCEKRLSLLPTVTSVEPPGVTGAAYAGPASMARTGSSAAIATARRVRMTLLGLRWTHARRATPVIAARLHLPGSGG